MKRNDINPLPAYFDRYIKLVDDIELSEAFEQSLAPLKELKKLDKLDNIESTLLAKIDAEVSAAGKWTAKEHLQHVADFERILSYRVLLFARQEKLIPQSIEQDRLTANSHAGKRTFADLADELKSVRAATTSLFASFDDATLQIVAMNWKYQISVLAMGFSIIGHQVHHLKFIEENYYSAV